MSTTLYTFIRRPLPVAGTTYELKTYSPEEFADAFKLNRPYADWAAAGHTLDDVIEFDDVEDAREFIRNERKSCAITDEDAFDLMATLEEKKDAAEFVAKLGEYKSEFTQLIAVTDNEALKYVYRDLRAFEAADWLISNDVESWTDFQLDTAKTCEFFKRALRDAYICEDADQREIGGEAERIAGRPYSRDSDFCAYIDKYDRIFARIKYCSGLVFACAAGTWVCYCDNFHGGKSGVFDGILHATAASDMLDKIARAGACFIDEE